MVSLRSFGGIVLVLFLSLFSIFPLLHPGFFPMHDDTQVARVYEMGKALRDGMFPVRWVQDLGYGYGYPIFNFYSPLPYYIGGGLTLIGIDALFATKLTFILAIILSGICMYAFVRNFLGELPALVSGVIYLYFPYHAVNIYVRGDLDELFAYAFMPLVFLGIYNLYYKCKTSVRLRKLWINIAFLSLTISFVILFHNLTSMMLLFFMIPLMVLALIIAQKKQLLLLAFGISLILGFGISGFYSIPALLEMKYTNVLSQVGGGADYKDHFVCIDQLWDSQWGFGGSTKGCIDGMSFRLGKINLILFVCSLLMIGYVLITNKLRSNRLLIYSSVLFFFLSIFLMTSLSKIIWDTLPFMGFLQYPWRFLNFAGVFIAIVIGVAIFYLEQVLGKKNIYILVFILVATILFYHAKLFVPKQYYDHDSSFYTNDYYLNWTVSKISDEYLPNNFEKPKNPEFIPNRLEGSIIPGVLLAEVIHKTGLIQAKVNVQEKAVINFPIAYFPAWKIFVDKRLREYKYIGTNYMVEVPQGAHIVEAKFIQTPIEVLSSVVSLISVLSLILGIIPLHFKFYGKKSS